MTDWDSRYLDLAALVGTWSKDPSTKCGTVIVRPDRSVASVGFNGFARNMSDAPALYADRPTKYSRVIHAEVNALLNAHDRVDGYDLYTTIPPCDRCTVQFIQAGIKRVVWPAAAQAAVQERWGDSIKVSLGMLDEAGVEWVAR